MAQLIGVQTPVEAQVREPALPSVWKLRLASGWIALVAAVIGLFAISWDIQWHSVVGRDRTLTAPHLFMLGSITVMGMVALIAVLIETTWSRRNRLVAQSGTSFAGIFSSSLGAYLVGYGALDTAIAFPIDQYWHTLYGIDVSLWAPFHIMALAGLCLITLGIADMLVSGAHLAMEQGAHGFARLGYIGAIIAFATLMGAFSFLTLPAVSNVGYIPLGEFTFTVYPLMIGAFGTFLLVIALRSLPWKFAGTSIMAVYLLYGLINFLIIPPLMTSLESIEQLSPLPGSPQISIAAIEWHYGMIFMALLLDIIMLVARRNKWSMNRTSRVRLIGAMGGTICAVLCYPLLYNTVQTHAIELLVHIGPSATVSQEVISAVNNLSSSSILLMQVSIIGVSLLFGLLGAYVGDWFGRGIGEAMGRKGEQ